MSVIKWGTEQVIHEVLDFQGVKACQSEPVEDSRGEAFARYASTGSA